LLLRGSLVWYALKTKIFKKQSNDGVTVGLK
jgi:hypothetical protein